MDRKKVQALIDGEIRRHLSQALSEPDGTLRRAHLEVVLALTYALEAMADEP